MTDAVLTGSNFIGSRESREAPGGFRAQALPEELRGPNPRGIWRLVDGRPTREVL